jgi:hypothetical protein
MSTAPQAVLNITTSLIAAVEHCGHHPIAAGAQQREWQLADQLQAAEARAAAAEATAGDLREQLAASQQAAAAQLQWLQQQLQGTQYQGILQQLPRQMVAIGPPHGSIAAAATAGVAGSAAMVLVKQEHDGREQQQQQQQGEQQHREQQQGKQQQRELLPAALSTAAAAVAATCGLGPAGLSLVKQELGALPSQQQLQYWQLADRPFDPADLQQLVTHYLMPRQAETLVGRTNRSGRGQRW